MASRYKSVPQFQVKWNDIRRMIDNESTGVHGSKLSFVIPKARNSGGNNLAV